MVLLKWRQAREALMESGRGANHAQDILDDLAHWGERVKGWSYRTPDGIRWLYYAGLDGDGQPRFEASEEGPGA